VVAVGGALGWWPRWSLHRRGAGSVGVKGRRGSFGRRSRSCGCAQAVATAGENGNSTAAASMAWRHGMASAGSSAQRGGPVRLGRSGGPYRRRAGSENKRGAARAGRGRPVRRRAGGQEQGYGGARSGARVGGQRGLRGSLACVLPRDGAGCVGKARGRLGLRGTAQQGRRARATSRRGATPASACQKCFPETLFEHAKLPKVE
jgi:hypothetical protein